MLILRRLPIALALVLAAAVAHPASATVLSLPVASGGIDQARTCTTTACSTAPWTLPSGTLFPATGTVTIDTAALTLSLALSVPSFTLSGAADNGVTALTLTGTTYTATVPITVSGPLGGLTSYTITAGQTGVVDPTLLTETGGGSSDPIYSAVRLTGQCGLLADGTGSCGFTFGRTGFLAPAPLSRYLEQTFNVGVVPEPGTLLLLGSGLLGLAVAGRRQG